MRRSYKVLSSTPYLQDQMTLSKNHATHQYGRILESKKIRAVQYRNRVYE